MTTLKPLALPAPRVLALSVNSRGSQYVCDTHGITPAQLAEHMGEHGYRATIWAGRVRYVAEQGAL